MKKCFIVTFGQEHVHDINEQTFNHNCVARVLAYNEEEARALFMPNFCFSYSAESWDEESIKYFPRGYIDIEV